jgi:hypothetical protein
LQGDEEDSRYMIDTIVPMVLRISLEREARIESLHTTIPPVNSANIFYDKPSSSWSPLRSTISRVLAPGDDLPGNGRIG